ncbi:MAG: pseudouridine synthase, partial [Azonexus sp.]
MPDCLPILFRDEHIVVIDKPPGLLVHRSEIDRHETRFAIQILRNQSGQRVWAAHRLDRGTSGVLLIGLNREVAGALGRQF